MNVLFIAVDTLRVDRFQRAEVMPELQALAAQSLQFEQAFAHAPWTLPSFATLFSGQIPPQHGAGGVADRYFGLRSEIQTWPEVLRDAGWNTAAIVNVDFLAEEFGATQGFEYLDARFSLDNHLHRDARATSDAALAWIREQPEGPFALFVHYFDPHAEYAPPSPWRERFADPRDADPTAKGLGTREEVVAWRTGKVPLTADLSQRAQRLYDGEVAYTDAQIGRLLRELRQMGKLNNTLIVFTSDHGEEFLDHGGFEHGHTLYDELLHVPLVLSLEGKWPGQRIERAVAHVQLARTICEVVGVPAPPSFAGPSLLSPTSTLDPLLGHAYGNFWGMPWEAQRDSTHKWIRIPTAKNTAREELYEWSVDAHEQRDVQLQAPSALERLREFNRQLHERAAREQWRNGPPARVSEETLQRLRNTGYVGEGPR